MCSWGFQEGDTRRARTHEEPCGISGGRSGQMAQALRWVGRQ